DRPRAEPDRRHDAPRAAAVVAAVVLDEHLGMAVAGEIRESDAVDRLQGLRTADQEARPPARLVAAIRARRPQHEAPDDVRIRRSALRRHSFDVVPLDEDLRRLAAAPADVPGAVDPGVRGSESGELD